MVSRPPKTPPPLGAQLLFCCRCLWPACLATNLKHRHLSPRRHRRTEESRLRSLQHALLTSPSLSEHPLGFSRQQPAPSLPATSNHFPLPTPTESSLRLCTSRAARFISPSGLSRPRLRRRALDTHSTCSSRRGSRCRPGPVVLQDTARLHLALPLSCSTTL